MKRRIRKSSAILFVLLIMALSAAACSSNTPNNPAPTAASTQQTASAADAGSGITETADAGSGATETADTGSGSTAETSGTESIVMPSLYENPVDLTIAYWNVTSCLAGGADDAVLQYIYDKFNLKIKPMEITWNDWIEKANIWAASGDLPDVTATLLDQKTYKSWADQGLIKALPDDMTPYPTIKIFLESPDVKTFYTHNDKFWAVPRMSLFDPEDGGGADRGVIIRKDWLDKLGMSKPDTFSEFEAMCRAFMNENPDGLTDVQGYTFRSPGFECTFGLGTSVPQMAAWAWMYEDGRWIPPYMAKNSSEIIKLLRKHYSEGILDRDFAILNADQGVEKFAQGKVGALVSQVSGNTVIGFKGTWETYNDDIAFEDAVDFIPVPRADDIRGYFMTMGTFWSETYFNASLSDEKMTRALALLEYLCTDEGIKMGRLGLPGIDWEYDGSGDVDIFIEGADQIGSIYPSTSLFNCLGCWNGWTQYQRSKLNEQVWGKKVMDRCVDVSELSPTVRDPSPVNWDINYLSTPAKDNLNVDMMPDVIKLVLGSEDIDSAWSEIQQGYLNSKGVQAAIDEVNEQAKILGIQP
jgi:putative aldouronate transport system substrate-binding protein